MKHQPLFLFIATFAYFSPASSDSSEAREKTMYSVSAQATKLAQQSIIVDGHIDVPCRPYEKWQDVTRATDGGDYDYPRTKQEGLNAP